MAGSYDGQLKFDTAVDTKGFQQGTNRLADIIGGGLITQAIQGLFGMITGQVDAAMRRLDTMAQFGRVMTTLTGDVAEANATLDATNEIVRGTAFGLDVAASAVQRFVASGMETKKATDVMSAWADATAFYTKGTNSDLETVTGALTKMNTRGKITMREMQQLLYAGIPAMDIYASAMGMSTEEVSEAMSQGELQAEQFIDVMTKAFTEGTEKFPAITGAAKKAGSSWAGSIDNMKAAVTRGVGAMLETFDGIFNIKENMVAFGKGIETVLKALATAFQFVADNGNIFIPIGVAIMALLVAYNAETIKATILSGLHTISIIAQNVAYAGLTIAIGLADAAQAIFNGTIEACPLVWFIALIAIVIAGVIALTNALNFSSEAYKEHKSDIEELGEAQDALADSMEASKQTYEDNASKLADSSVYAVNLYKNLQILYSEYQKSGKGADNLKNVISELNKTYDGMNLALDEESGLLNMQMDEIEKYIQLKGKQQQADLVQSRANELMQEAASLEQQRNELAYKAKAIMEDESLTYIQKVDLMKQIGDEYQELEDLMKDNQLTMKATTDSMRDGLKKEEQAWLNAQDAMHGAVDAEGNDLQTLADKYGVSTKSIINDILDSGDTLADWSEKTSKVMTEGGWSIKDYADKWGVSVKEIESWIDEHNSTLEEWNEHQKDITTDSGQTIEQLAEKWGTTVDDIRQEMFQNDLDLQGWEDNQNDILEDWQESVEDHTDAVINDFEEVPTEMDISFDEMVKILNENAQKYQRWQDLMGKVAGKLSAETIAQLQKIGPASSQILEEVANDTSGAKARELESAFRSAFGTATNAANAEVGKAGAVGESFVGEYEKGVVSQEVLAQRAAESTVAATLDTMTSRVQESQSRITTVWESLKTAIVVAFKPLAGRMSEVMTDVMNAMINKMSSMSGRLYSKASEIATGVINRTKKAYDIHSPSKVMQDIYKLVMDGGWLGMDRGEDRLYRKSDEITSGVLERFAGMPQGLATAFAEDMSAVVGAVHNGMVASQPIFASGTPEMALAGAGVVYETNVTFNEPADQPDVIARKVSQIQRYGLAGRRGN